MAKIPNKKDQHLHMILRKQSGVGLIEVLIALVISSFALLGFAGLQMASLRYQKVAQFRSLASQYSADMADRVRANVAGAKDGQYVTADTYPTNATATACATSCTPAQIAAQDLYNWRVALAGALTGGWGSIAGDSTNGFTITVYFKEPTSTGESPKKCASDPNVDARCFTTVFLP